MSPDDREIEFPESEKATKGKQKTGQNGKNALTWLGEADRSLGNAIRYYGQAKEWYSKDGNTIMVENCERMINTLEEVQS